MYEKKNLGFLVQHELAAPLNIIFDIDHTLIYAFPSDTLPPHLRPGMMPDLH
jgi:hypothetical protein